MRWATSRGLSSERPLGLLACAGPAPGYRDAGNNGLFGALGGVGNNGYSWSSAVSGTNALRLNFNSTNLDPSNATNRAHGFQVRCLQVFIGRAVPFFFFEFVDCCGPAGSECIRITPLGFDSD